MKARGALVTLMLVLALTVVSAPASQAQERLIVPTTPGKSVSATWEGTVLPGVNPNSECDAAADAGQDVHDIELVVPRNAYRRVVVTGTIKIEYAGAPDMILTVRFPDETAKSADSGSFDADEAVTLANPIPGAYSVLVCMFAGATPQDYAGTITLTAALPAPPAPPPCAKPKTHLGFTKPAYVDMARAGGEPSIEVHPDGTYLYGAHAGTTHFYTPRVNDPSSSAFSDNYRGQVYYWVSDDRGETWQFVDRSLPPSGVPNSGFSDPDFAIDAAGNVYISEINLVNIAMSKSSDSGHSYELKNVLSQTLTDRQWSAAGPEDVVFFNGNASGGGTFPADPAGHSGHTLYRSIDGGATFSAGVDDPGGLGDMKFDHRSGTLLEPHLDSGRLQVATFRNALALNVQKALTPELHTVADGVELLSHWPAIDVDRRGNVYITWDESGDGTRDAGIWYSHSTDGGRTWAQPSRVDEDDRTDIWPWIAVGRSGRVAIGWFGNSSALDNQDAESAGEEDGWNVYVAQSLTGLGCGRSTTAGFTITQATPGPFHYGTLCQGGTTCQAEVIDRRLGDYFTIDTDTFGRVVVGYSDTREGGAVSLPAFLRQTRGPRF